MTPSKKTMLQVNAIHGVWHHISGLCYIVATIATLWMAFTVTLIWVVGTIGAIALVYNKLDDLRINQELKEDILNDSLG